MGKTKFGYMKCPDCTARVVVKVNDKETLSYNCDECDSFGYARKGAGNYAAWLGRIERTAPAGEKKEEPTAGGAPKKKGDGPFIV